MLSDVVGCCRMLQMMVFGEHARYGTLPTAVSLFLRVGRSILPLIRDDLCNVTSGQKR